MAKKWMLLLFLVFVSHSLFCQTGGFPMEEYQAAVRSRNFAVISDIIRTFETNTRFAIDSILYKAVEAGDGDLVKTLLDAGIPRELETGTGHTVSLIYIALNKGHRDLAALLADYFHVQTMDVSAAIRSGDTGLLDLFITKGADIHAGGVDASYFGYHSYSFLNVAVRNGQVEMVRRMLNEGVGVNTLDVEMSFSGRYPDDFPTFGSALDYARETGNGELVSLLTDSGAKSGFTILNEMSAEELEEKFRYTNYGVYATTADDLRYRAEPVLGAAVLGYLRLSDMLYVVCRNQEEMEIDGFADYWYYVISDSGKRGWAYGGYIASAK